MFSSSPRATEANIWGNECKATLLLKSRAWSLPANWKRKTFPILPYEFNSMQWIRLCLCNLCTKRIYWVQFVFESIICTLSQYWVKLLYLFTQCLDSLVFLLVNTSHCASCKSTNEGSISQVILKVLHSFLYIMLKEDFFFLSRFSVFWTHIWLSKYHHKSWVSRHSMAKVDICGSTPFGGLFLWPPNISHCCKQFGLNYLFTLKLYLYFVCVLHTNINTIY